VLSVVAQNNSICIILNHEELVVRMLKRTCSFYVVPVTLKRLRLVTTGGCNDGKPCDALIVTHGLGRGIEKHASRKARRCAPSLLHSHQPSANIALNDLDNLPLFTKDYRVQKVRLIRYADDMIAIIKPGVSKEYVKWYIEDELKK